MGVCDRAVAAEMGEQEARKRETTFSSVVDEAYRARVQRIEPIGETPLWDAPGNGEGWGGLHQRMAGRAHANILARALSTRMAACHAALRKQPSRSCPHCWHDRVHCVCAFTNMSIFRGPYRGGRYKVPGHLR